MFWGSFVALMVACAFAKLAMFFCGMTSSIELIDRGCHVFLNLLIPLLLFDAFGLIVSIVTVNRRYAAIAIGFSMISTYGANYLVNNWK
jgi:hypothetical protein